LYKVCGLPCEVYSRVVGYLRPVNGWNKGKKQEFKDRVVYKIDYSNLTPEEINANMERRFAGKMNY